MPWFVEAKEKASRHRVEQIKRLGPLALLHAALRKCVYYNGGELSRTRRRLFDPVSWFSKVNVLKLKRRGIGQINPLCIEWTENNIFPQYITVLSNARRRNSSLLDTISSKHSFANRPKQPYPFGHSKFSKVCRDFGARLNPTNLHVPPQGGKGSLQECLYFGLQTWIGSQLASKSPSQKAGPKALKHVFKTSQTCTEICQRLKDLQ